MNTLVVDFETYYDDDEYSLSKLPTLEYIRDPRFYVYGAAVKWNKEPAFWVPGDVLSSYFAERVTRCFTSITHNSNFDNTILFERYGVSPAQRVDTLALCRALLCQDLDFDLDTIGPVLGFEGKVGGGDALKAVKGIRAPSPEQLARLAEYAVGDAELTYKIFDLLYPCLPEAEAPLLDLFIRMSTEGVLRFDRDMAFEGKQELVEERQRRLEKVGLRVNAEGKVPELSSRDKFAQLLRDRGVEPPTKVSKTTGKKIYAFSKKDPDFIALKQNPDVAHFIEAKLVWSSNSALKRLDKLVSITDKPPYTLPVQLNFSGAHTHRPSGGGGINMQNLNRGSKLRLAITAPPGCVLVVVDLSQIELRINMSFSNQVDVVETLRPGEYVWKDNEVEWKGADIYSLEATRQFGYPVDKSMKNERQFGKVCQLGLGFYMGAPRFRAECAIGPMGIDPILLSDEEAARAVHIYRQNHPMVKASWDWLGNEGIPALMQKNVDGVPRIERGPVVFEHEAVRLPNDLLLQYPNLYCDEERDYRWGVNDHSHKIHGGVLQENIVQALAQIVCKHFMAQLTAEFRTTAPIVHQVHDEIIMCCQERDAMDVLKRSIEIMSTPPDWCPDLPVRAEGGFDWRYSK